jgi:hypothetical protein
MRYLSLRIVFHALLLYISHELPGVVSDNFVRSSWGTVTGEINERAENSPLSMPVNTYDEFITDSRDQSSTSRPLSSGLAAHRKRRVLRERLYPSLFTWSVNENMLAAVFSNVSKETLDLYLGTAGGEAMVGDRDDSDMVGLSAAS